MTPNIASARSTAPLSIDAALSDGDLVTALDLAKAKVKSNPTDPAARVLLAELNLIAGDLEKADLHAHTAGLHSPDWVTGLAVFRAHLRGVHARNAFYATGAIPAFGGDATDADDLSVRIVVAMQADSPSEIAAARAAVLSAPSPVLVRVDGGDLLPFSGLDERLLRTVEVVTGSGNYVRLDVEKIESIRLDAAARRPRHIALRPAHLTFRTGDSADCMVPALYPETGVQAADAALRLGHGTDWLDDRGVAIGIGQICWLIGDDVLPIQDIGEISFHAA